MDSDAINDLDEDLMELRKKEREQVRDFIERLVESMLGGNLDEVSVSQIYNDKKYDSLFVRYHADLSNALTDLGSALHISISNLPITGQTPCSAHAYLKQLVERFVGEAGELPDLKKYEDHPAHPEETLSNRTYEDLLSTAIINKVVQTSQNEARSSATSSRNSATSRRSGNKEYFFGEETLENKWRNHDNARDDASSVSSLDDWVRSDSSISSSKYIDRVSLTIKQHIEEGSSSEDEQADSISHLHENSLLPSSDETWHENWYFQKRRLTNSSSPVPVPMLVPNPITEAKVLIGDKEAEELSDIDSDYGDPEMVPDIKNILVNSKTIIGGKNVIHTVDDSYDAFNEAEGPGSQEKHEEPSLLEPVILDVDVNEHLQSENVNNLDKHTLPALKIDQPENEGSSFMSIESNTEQDTEYTEQYASLTRTFLKTSTPIPRIAQVSAEDIEPVSKIENGFQFEDLQRERLELREDSSDSDDEKLRIFKGSYSEREKEKWKHSSIEIPHNPYSPENLERRLSSRSSNGSSSSIYGRDYYIRQASKSAGTRSKKLMDDAEVEYSPTLNGNENNSEDPYKLVKAIPIVIDSEHNEFESMGESSLTSPTRPSIHDISSDSDLSIERVYNLQSGKVFEKKGNISQEIPTNESYSPEGLKYIAKEFDEDIKTTETDENHNTPILNSKATFLRSLTHSDEDENDNIENEYVNSEEINPKEVIEKVEVETIDIVPYNENKFKATLEMFKVVSEKAEINKTYEKLETPTNLHEIKLSVVDADDLQDINDKKKDEFSLDVVDSVLVTDIHTSIEEEKQIMDYKINTSDYSEEEILSDNREFSLEYSTDINEDDISRTESSLETDPEIMDLKGKRLVKDLLGRFSKSYPNISTVPMKKPEESVQTPPHEIESVEVVLQSTITEEKPSVEVEPSVDVESSVEEPYAEETEEEATLSVKSLKQLFDKNNITTPVKVNPKHIYSLTARSLPQQFRQKLKSDDEASLPNEETVADTSSVTEENAELLPVDITKNRIAFYEHLGNKKET